MSGVGKTEKKTKKRPLAKYELSAEHRSRSNGFSLWQ